MIKQEIISRLINEKNCKLLIYCYLHNLAGTRYFKYHVIWHIKAHNLTIYLEVLMKGSLKTVFICCHYVVCLLCSVFHVPQMSLKTP